MPIEFLGMGATNDGSETNRRSGGSFDPEYTVRLARTHEEHGWDRVLTAYGSGTPDPAQAAALIALKTETLQVLLAHRPNLSIPTFAAKTFATLDQLSGGRFAVHFITGGNDHEQQREGDYLRHDERYDRTREYIQIVKRVWSEREPFDHSGTYYQFSDFVADVFPLQAPHPMISFGGSSDAAYAVGAAEADVYCLWGEPLADTAEQIARVESEAAAIGRPGPASRSRSARSSDRRKRRRGNAPTTSSAASKRAAGRRTHGSARRRVVRRTPVRGDCSTSPRAGDRFDRALWTATSARRAVRATPTRSWARRRPWSPR